MLMESTMIEKLREERYIFNLLKHIFWAEPAKEFLRDIQNVDIIPEEDEIDRGLNLIIETVKSNNSRLDEYLNDLSLEFARLFIGPKNPPAIPYASFYLSESKTIMSDVTIDVRKMYLDAGMAVQNLYSIPDDHIGIELEFLQYLTEKTIDLFEHGQREDASRLYEMREDFLNDHMASWIPFFADKVIESTQDDFYKGAAFILKGIIKNGHF